MESVVKKRTLGYELYNLATDPGETINVNADSSVCYTSDYKPLVSGFDYEKLGVVPHLPAYYR